FQSRGRLPHDGRGCRHHRGAYGIDDRRVDWRRDGQVACGLRAGSPGDHRRLQIAPSGRPRALSWRADFRSGRRAISPSEMPGVGRLLWGEFDGTSADGEGAHRGSPPVHVVEGGGTLRHARPWWKGSKKGEVRPHQDSLNPLMKTIAVLGTFDTKGAEHAFVASQIRDRGHKELMIDVGGYGAAQCRSDIGSDEVAASGGIDLAALRARADRGAMVDAMTQAAPTLLARLAAE